MQLLIIWEYRADSAVCLSPLSVVLCILPVLFFTLYFFTTTTK